MRRPNSESIMELSFTAVSIDGALIRLRADTWSYTNACCDDVLGTIERPDYVLCGPGRTQIAVREMTGGRYLEVRYCRWSCGEGFVISAAVTPSLNEISVIWRARRLGPAH